MAQISRAALEPMPEPADPLRFEELVSELSARFVDAAADEVETALIDAQRLVVETLGLDRSTLFQLDASGADLTVTHTWGRPGLPTMSTVPIGPVARRSFPQLLERMRRGEPFVYASHHDLAMPATDATLVLLGPRSHIALPLSAGGRLMGAIAFGTFTRDRNWPPQLVSRLGLIATVFAGALARKQGDQALRAAHAEVVRLKEAVNQENHGVRGAAREVAGTGIVGHSMAIRRVMDLVRQVAVTDATVLLLGETGTGKELFASCIHELSQRRDRAMVRVNCAAIPSALVESELFGREKGAYTGALSRQIGRFETANHSTIFLDEIGDLPLEVQVKLLRAQQIERLGSPRPIRIDTRIVAATHRHLERAITDGRFREDLFYRLNVFPIQVPALRDRLEDVPLLVERFVEDFSKTFSKRVEAISSDSMAALQQYDWPGNVRELRNVVERAMIVHAGGALVIELPRGRPIAVKTGSTRLSEVETSHVRSVLDATGWRVRGAGGAAEQLGLKPSTLEARMAKLGLQRPRPGRPS
jgi:formate hydrogenlyase transcriptional activator